MWNPKSARGLRTAVTALTGLIPLAAACAVAPSALSAGVGAPGSGTHAGGPWLTSAISPLYRTTLDTVRDAIDANTGAAAGLTGKGVGIALVDTGVTPVPGLPASQVVNGPDLSIESQSDNLRYLDSYGHGTHMAGIMIANDPSTGTKGIAPDAKLTSVKVGTGTGAVDVTQVMAAVDWVVQHRDDDPANPIRIINLSYGSGGTPPAWLDPLQYTIEQAWKAGIVVVSAAGNGGNYAGHLTDPASDPWGIAVGAAMSLGTPVTSDDKPSTFTNTDLGRDVDLWAPGDSVVSLRDPGSGIDTLFPLGRVGSTLFKGTGTSQATAVVSASAALVLQAHPELTPNQVKSYLMDSAVHVRSFRVGLFTHHLNEINVNNALNLVTADPRHRPDTPSSWGNGLGLIAHARGTSFLLGAGKALTGERTLLGPLDTWTLARRVADQESWSGGSWMGYRMAGDDWTGTSWASRTWAPATWKANSTWFGSTSWVDPSWNGRYWSGRYWSGSAWSGRYWSSDDWSTASWH